MIARFTTAFFCLLLLCIAPVSYALAQSKTDSLLNVLEQCKAEDTSRVVALNNLGRHLRSNDPNKAVLYIKEAEKLARKLGFQRELAVSLSGQGLICLDQGKPEEAMTKFKEALSIRESINDVAGIGHIYNNFGSAYETLSEYDSAIVSYEKALTYFKKAGDQKGLGNAINNIGIVHLHRGDLDKAHHHFIQALPIREKINDKKGVAATLNNLGLIQYSKNNLDGALEYYIRSVEIKESIGSTSDLSASYNNIAVLLYSKKDYKQTLNYLEKSLAIKLKSGDRKGIADNYNNMGSAYKEMKQFGPAQKYYSKALAIREEIGDKKGVSEVCVNMGKLACGMGKYNDALEPLLRALDIGTEIKSKEDIKEAYDGLASAYEGLGNYKKAFESQVMYTRYKDSVLNEESAKQINELQTKFDTEKKDKEIKLQKADLDKTNAELDKKNFQRNAFIIGFGLVGIMAGLIFRSYRNKKKANELLAVQNKKIEHQKEQLAEKNKDITDSISYARRIQGAILPSNSYLDQHLREHFVLYKPKDIVSGDFYWAFAGDGFVMVAAADCTGHGVPGAFMSMIGTSLLNEIVVEKNITRPDEILNTLRAGIIRALNTEGSELATNDGMDISLCKLTHSTRTLEVAAANNPVWTVSGNELAEIKPDKFPVGRHAGEMKPFGLKTMQLEKGDIFYLFSDGYADQFGGPSGKKFKYKQLQDLLVSVSASSMQEQKKTLDHSLESWRGNLEQVDDILVIGVRV